MIAKETDVRRMSFLGYSVLSKKTLEGLHGNGRQTVCQNPQPKICIPGMLTIAAHPQYLVKATNIANPSNIACAVGFPQCLPS